MIPNSGNTGSTKVQHPLLTAASDTIPLFAGRPKREKVIGREDLMDLDIILHTCDTVEAFLAKA
jgi:hypothetical protein